MPNYCELCGAKCKKKFYIQVNKTGGPKLLCCDCFDRLFKLTATEINKELRARRKF